MHICVNLDKNKMETLKKLNKQRNNFNNLNKDFFAFYNGLNFIQKHFIRKTVKLLKNNGTYTGYIWINNDSRKYYKIESINAKQDANLSKSIMTLLKSFAKKRTYFYECEKNDFNYKVLKDLGFIEKHGTVEMYCVLENYIDFSIPKSITIRKFLPDVDEKLRCDLQNKIFKKDDRIPLSVQDIYFDEAQEYYFADGSFFIKLGDSTIGYGQLIMNNYIPTIVNFGILDEFRGHGYGKLFIKFFLKLAEDNGFDKIFLKVDYSNKIAFKLYESVGFKICKETYTWKLKL
ncbi:GNAT family N-acetyltransferase [Clostridium akagii]|uniref:GNAT family N-acetyltransferase n=1 Tax=Clostridium akagii TaxID=91623 RepID=UPI00047A7BC7|nr:GNAT family N-acetyltransferase [Clostridium akagii]